MGKTQLCHMLSFLATKDLELGFGVIYIDTEKAFSASRFSFFFLLCFLVDLLLNNLLCQAGRNSGRFRSSKFQQSRKIGKFGGTHSAYYNFRQFRHVCRCPRTVILRRMRKRREEKEERGRGKRGGRKYEKK